MTQAPEDATVDPARVDATIAQIDARLSRQLDEILHHPRFAALERAWRGLWFLVERTDFAENIRVEMLDCRKDELRADLSRPGGVENSGLFALVYTAEYGRVGGEPFGAILADMRFGPDPDDLTLLQRAGAVARAALAPFIAAAAPQFFGGDDFAILGNLRDLGAELQGPRCAAWNDFRETEESRFVGLLLPRFLLRLPYGAEGTPAPTLGYEEQMGADREALCWGNATYAFATRLVDSFARYRWCPNILGPQCGGDVGPLPALALSGDAGGAIPTEIAIGARLESELANEGFIAFAVRRGEPNACFLSARTPQRPKYFGDTEEGRAAELNARLGQELPYLFILTRVMHYLRVMYRSLHALWGDRAEVEKELNDWIGQFVADRSVVTAAARGRRPLRKAQIIVRDPADPEAWRRLELRLRPHFKYMGAFFTLQIAERLDR